MDEVTGILLFTGALFAGLLVLSWTFGDFNKPKGGPSASA